jgi:cation diffusion facilitator CzcD-associated flavoprotein CzcO
VTASATETAVVGAGPYGLSVAAHLRARGRPFRIFGSPMASWRERMPAGMYLKSEGCASNLSDPAGAYTLGRHCADHGLRYGDLAVPVPLDTFVGYGLAFQRRLVPDLEDTEVVALDRAPGGYELRLRTGERVRARNVVLAVGITHFSHVPAGLARLPRELGSHTSDHHDLSGFAGRDVTVVGAGQSALETATLAAEQGASVRVLVRRPVVVWNADPPAEPRPLRQRLRHPMTGIGPGWRSYSYCNAPRLFQRLPEATRVRTVHTVLGPAGSWWLRPRVLERVELLLGHTVRAAEPDGDKVRLRVERADGSVVDIATEHVVAGTGYRIDLARLEFLSAELLARLRRVRQAPLLSPSFEASEPGLYVVGLASAYGFGPMMRFVFGADYTAGRLVAHLAARGRAAPR